uniref:Uncharacterized protein n=1 Tax=Arundo donax TaxID=35708 RepID=A0A0A8ZB07_ARUDO
MIGSISLFFKYHFSHIVVSFVLIQKKK